MPASYIAYSPFPLTVHLFFFTDEVGAVVLDMGSSNIRAGYAGEDTPVALFPTVS